MLRSKQGKDADAQVLRTCVLLDELIIKEQGGGAGGPVVVVQVGPPVAHNRSGKRDTMGHATVYSMPVAASHPSRSRRRTRCRWCGMLAAPGSSRCPQTRSMHAGALVVVVLLLPPPLPLMLLLSVPG